MTQRAKAIIEVDGSKAISANSNVARSFSDIERSAFAAGTVFDQYGKVLSSPTGPVHQMDRATTAANNTAKALGRVRKTSGTVNSTLLSTGRIVQDLPFGFGAVANNIAFTVEQMGFLVATAGGATKALRALWSAILGPIGLILGINTLVAGLQFLSMRAKKTEESVSSLTKAFAGLLGGGGLSDQLGISIPKLATVDLGRLLGQFTLLVDQQERSVAAQQALRRIAPAEAGLDQGLPGVAKISDESLENLKVQLAGNKELLKTVQEELANRNAMITAYNFLIENSAEFAANVERERRITELLAQIEESRTRDLKSRVAEVKALAADPAVTRLVLFLSGVADRAALGQAIQGASPTDLPRTIDNITEKVRELQQANEETWKADNVSAYFGAAKMGAELFGTSLDSVLRRAGRSSETFFKAWKAYAIAEALINTYTAATHALRVIPPPFNIAAAGTAIAFGLAQVAAIRATQPGRRGGGGGSGSGGGGAPAQVGAFIGGNAVASTGNPVLSSLSVQPSQVQGTLVADGRDLVAVIETTGADSRAVSLTR